MHLQLSTFVILLQAATLTTALPTLDDSSLERRQDGGSIAACETAVASQHVACMSGCNGDANCILTCTSTAVAGYTGCPAGAAPPAPPPA
ncbi:unnamed protein product [Discula destructiva]